jgi:TRAP-type C4-dicarboxylate transport system permease small subunit
LSDGGPLSGEGFGTPDGFGLRKKDRQDKRDRRGNPIIFYGGLGIKLRALPKRAPSLRQEECFMKKALLWLNDYLEEVLSSFFLALMTALIALQIVCRLASIPLSWTEELARYTFVWLIYMSCSYAVKKRAHIKVEILTILVKRRGQIRLAIFADLAFLAFAVLVTYFGCIGVYKLKVVNPQFSPALGFPMWIAYLSVALGFTLMIYRLITDIVLYVREFRSIEGEGAAA